MADFSSAISGIESGGNYGLLGPTTRTGDRAYGKYQVMGANVGPWTQEVLGAPMSPQQFLANPQAQDAVFNAKFGQYVQKYGPEGAARAWFAGPGGMNNMNARDQLGTSVAQYGQRFSQLLNGPQQSYNPSSNTQVSGEGQGGQALQQQSSYNSTPYTPGPQGTISNTGAPTQNSGEIAGQGARGWNIYQTTPSWTGSPLSQSPPARSEGDFQQAPSISGPQNPLLQRQQMLRQQILAQAMQNIPRGYQFKLG